VSAISSRPMSWLRRMLAYGAKPRCLWWQASGFVPVDGGDRAGDFCATPWPQWLAEHPGTAIDLVVSNDLQHQLVCDPDLPLGNGAAVQAYARQQFAHYFGNTGLNWPVADWHANKHCGATALHGIDWAALQLAAKMSAVRLRSVRPAWSLALAWQSQREPGWLSAPHAAFAWIEGTLLCWVRLKDAVCVSVQQLRLAQASLDSLGQTLAYLRAADADGALLEIAVLGFGLTGATKPSWPGLDIIDVGGTAPQPEWLVPTSSALNRVARKLPHPDFMRTHSERSALAWSLAIAGLLALTMTSWSVFERYQSLDVAQQRLAQLQQQRGAAPIPALVRLQAVKSAATDVRAAREVQALLLQDWGALLTEVARSGAQAQVSWVTLDFQSSRRELRLEGFAADKAAALQVAAALSSAPGWSDVLVTRLQAADGGRQRFELSARLTPGDAR